MECASLGNPEFGTMCSRVATTGAMGYGKSVYPKILRVRAYLFHLSGQGIFFLPVYLDVLVPYLPIYPFKLNKLMFMIYI